MERRVRSAKRLLLALSIGAVVFRATAGFAASAGVSSPSLGAGNAAVSSCQSGGPVDVGFSPSSSAAGTPTLDVTVGDIDGACGSKAIRITLVVAGPSGSSSIEQSDTVPPGGGSVGFSFPGVAASDVTGVRVVIAG